MPEIQLQDGRCVPYSIRVSRRSRRVRLTVDPRNGVVMVTPPGVDRDWLHELAASWSSWVAAQLAQMGLDELTATGPIRPTLPDRIVLHAVGEQWDVSYRYAPSTSARIIRSGPGTLLLSGDCGDQAACRRALQRWLARRGAQLLPVMLQQLSDETGLVYSSVAVRSQRSRWGSCSSSGAISLNCQLLFLPPELARHVLLHELCHTVQLNHSARFWKTVARFEPELERLRGEMHRSWAHVPAWSSAA